MRQRCARSMRLAPGVRPRFCNGPRRSRRAAALTAMLAFAFVCTSLWNTALGAPGEPIESLTLDAASKLSQIRGSQQPAVVLFRHQSCTLCSQLMVFWDKMSLQLPAGSTWHADCDANPNICESCGVRAGHLSEESPILKAWTGELFVPYDGADIATGGPRAIIDWLMSYPDWDLGAKGTAALNSADLIDNTASLTRGKLQPWTGQALPAQIFLPSVAPTGIAKKRGKWPVIINFHGGNDGPWVAMEQQSLAYQLVNNKSYAASFPFIAILPCTECTRDGKMVPYGNAMYGGGRPNFGECGFTPRNLLRVDRLLKEALLRLNGDTHRVILTSTSYGGRGLYWYAASRPHVFAALVPMAASISPNVALAEGICCNSGAPSCCPAVWHFVGGNDRPSMVKGHDDWDEIYRWQQKVRWRKTDYKYTRYAWAPAPRQKEYSYMTGHAPYDLAWPDPALQEWMLKRVCQKCRGPPPNPASGPDTSWKASIDSESNNVLTLLKGRRKSWVKTMKEKRARRKRMKTKRKKRRKVSMKKAQKNKPAKAKARRRKTQTIGANKDVRGAGARRGKRKRSRAAKPISKQAKTSDGKDSKTTLHSFIRRGDLASVRQLLQKGASLAEQDINDKSRTPLHVAAHHGQQEIVQLLLRSGAEVNAGEVANWRPLHEVAHTGHLGIGKLLMKSGADVNAKADGGWTSLHQAAGNGHPDFVSFLIDNGIDVNAASLKEGFTALHIAAQMKRSQVAKVLLMRGADRSKTDVGGHTALQYALQHNDMLTVSILQQAPMQQSPNEARSKSAKAYSCDIEDLQYSASGLWSVPSACEALDLSRARIGQRQMAALSEALAPEKTPSLSTLNLSFNNLGDESVIHIAAIVKRNSLVRVELAAIGITSRGLGKLAKALAGGKTGSVLEYLELSGNQIGDDGVKRLCMYLLRDANKARALSLLALHANGISDDGAIQLSKALPYTRISYVGLNMNKIGDRGARAFSMAISNAESSVSILKLNNNQIGDPGATDLSEALTLFRAKNQHGKRVKGDVKRIQLQIAGNDRISTSTLEKFSAARWMNKGIGPIHFFMPGQQISTKITGVTMASFVADPIKYEEEEQRARNGASASADALIFPHANLKHAFVLFTKPKCKSCKILKNMWRSLSKKVSLHGRLWLISCASHEGICEKYGVKPGDQRASLEVWGPGGRIIKYQGSLSPKRIGKFIRGYIKAKKSSDKSRVDEL